MGDIPDPEPDAVMAIPESPPSSLTLRVFYLRLSRCAVDESKLDTLTVTYTPLTPDTVLEASGGDQHPPCPLITTDKRSVSCSLRRDRVDAASEEATFASTATVRILSGSARFEVRNGEERLLVGILETCDVEERLLLLGEDVIKAATEKRGGGKRRSWVMRCQVAAQRGGAGGFLRRGGGGAAKKAPPTVEVYVAGVVKSTPVVFTKAMQLRFRRPRRVKQAFMEPIPECADLVEDAKETTTAQEQDTQEPYKPDPEDDTMLYTDADEYSEQSWFTAGVRLGVGICLGVGIGAGLLARSYQSTSRTLTRRLISKLL